ncbi:MAG: hypothetical protein G3M78_04485 [Candidatus Nitrohelix vancouverensis]|uniref:Uncharacterized protein n=1 Tax=Candidatus Nitrohelix vancouverensis TaxID=2705534 RepID=A0A7T0C1A1_9BACT|nr:MAG: hypothetical protein G3M78_04485 [Candidatus Nitrohelix vancouverensis]
MNIFILDTDPSRCARYHCDRHVVKMILESAQLLSGAVRLSGLDCGYKLTHANHPCAIWTRRSLSNWNWLRKLAAALNKEYRYRFRKTVNHKSFDMIQSLPSPAIADCGLTAFAQAMPEQYRQADASAAYRNYYVGEKSRLLKWTRRQTPVWALKLQQAS